MKIKFLFTLFLAVAGPVVFGQNVIKVQLAPELKGPYTGRLIVYTMADTAKSYNSGVDEPAFSMDVKDWKAGETQTITTEKAFNYMKPLNELKGYFKFIAILDTNTKERPTSAPGNLYTRKEAIFQLSGDAGKPVDLTLTHVFPPRKFAESDSIKELVFRSTIMSDFKKEPTFIKAAIILPSSYNQSPTRTYPVIYVIPGWGGDHFNANNKGQRDRYGVGQGEEKIYVFLNPDTQDPFGLHAFVDSRVNGPWGTAFVKEFMPYMEQRYRASSNPDLNFLTGQSTGGYGVLWLALHFPDKFGGCWSTAPDPIDFNHFIGVNVYKDQNFYKDQAGQDRGFYVVNGTPQMTIRHYMEKEVLEGDGGQFQAFEAEFGVADKNGRPLVAYDRRTGTINHSVIDTWKPYDLSLYVQQNWSKIRKHAAGKIRIYAGSLDNFFLQDAVTGFTEKIKKVKAEIYTEIIPGADHFSIRTPEFIKKMHEDMDAIIRKNMK